MKFDKTDMVNYKDTIEAIGLTAERSIIALEAIVKGSNELDWVKEDPNHKEVLGLAQYILENKEEYLAL